MPSLSPESQSPGFQPSQLWQWIALDDFRAPTEAHTERVRTGLRALLMRLIRNPNADPEFEHPALKSAPLHFLDIVFPKPEWTRPAAEALGETLSTWLTAPAEHPNIQVLVAAPYSRTGEIVEKFAAQYDLPLIQPPTITQIRSADPTWMDNWPVARDKPLVLLSLERCFMRHVRGITPVRMLFDYLERDKRPCLIVCDSWAWTYLAIAVPIHRSRVKTWTLAPLDGSQLALWLHQACVARARISLTVRRTDNGRQVLPLGDAPLNQKATNAYFDELAVISRGNPGIAWALWHHNMHVAVDQDVEAEVQEEAEKDRGYTIWMRPWDEIALPVLTSGAAGPGLLVLHALLLHTSLTLELLAELLPMPPGTIADSLQRLQSAGILETSGDQWSVSPLAYPAVRAYLRDEGYLISKL